MSLNYNKLAQKLVKELPISGPNESWYQRSVIKHVADVLLGITNGARKEALKEAAQIVKLSRGSRKQKESVKEWEVATSALNKAAKAILARMEAK